MDQIGLILQLVTLMVTVAGLGVVYGTIRADLSNLKGSIDRVQATAERAHRRIDDLIQRPGH